MSKKNKKKQKVSKAPVAKQSSKKGSDKEFVMPKVSEFKKPEPIKASSYVITIVQTLLLCVVWTFAAMKLFPAGTMVATVAVAVLYFLCVTSMYVIRNVLECKRRYSNKVDRKTMLYYSQMIQSDRKWSLYIGMAFFAVSMVLRWLFRTPNFEMSGIDIATCFYLGYLWTCKYKGEENLPFEYMETIFLLYVAVSNYVVFFIG